MKDSWNKIANPVFKAGPLDFDLSSCRLATKFTRAGNGGSKTLVVWFHAAIDRARRATPAFPRQDKDLIDSAHQIAIADPTLDRHANLIVAWYLGDERLNLQKELSGFLRALADALGVTRTVFVGGSAGGFASLYFSLRHKSSCAVAVQPQTKLSSFDYFRKYLETCWPNGASDQVQSGIETDVCEAYAQGFSNCVIYIQSAGDNKHLRNHFAPFQYATRRDAAGKIMFHVDFWGHMDHAAVPDPVINGWVRSAVLAPRLDAASILTTHYALCAPGGPSGAARISRSAAPPSSDLATADLLRDALLERAT